MYRLTEKRLLSARPILEKYRALLFERRVFDAGIFERELRELWKIGYQEMKRVALQLLKMEDYREVAIYYMEHINSCVVSEFKPALAALYGLKVYDVPERADMQRRFWANVFESAGR